MSRIRKILGNNRNAICVNLVLVALMGAVGFFMFDVIEVLFEEETDTVAPIGTMCAYIGIYVYIILYAMQHGYPMFQLQVSMGQTRRSFFREELCLNTGLLFVDQLLCYGLYHLELWKFDTFNPKYEPDQLVTDILILFHPLVILLITLFCVSIGLLFVALVLRFGAKAYLGVWGLYMFFLLAIQRLDDVIKYFEQHSLSTSLIFLLFLAVVLCATVFLVLAWQLMKRQQVN